MFSTKQDQPDKPQVITNSQPSSVPFYRMDDRLFACEASMDSLHITSESDIFENVVCSCVVVKGRLRTNIDFWLGIMGSNWLLKVIREGYCLSFVDLPSKRFFRNHDTLFFLYKNLFYKNVEAEIDPNFKNVLRTFLRLRVD